MAFKGDKYIWTDRKRFLGMPLSFTKYAMSDDRLFIETGAVSLKNEEVLLYRVRDISVSRSFWQRLFSVGTVRVVSSDKSCPDVIMKNIRNPLEVKEVLHENVEEMKIKRRIRIGEVTTDSMDDIDLDDDDFDDR